MKFNKKFLIIIIIALFALSGCDKKSINNNSNAERMSYSKDEENKTEVEEAVFSTPILDKTPNRVDNISLTCSKINNTIVKKGETFSFCDTIGEVSSNTGYKEATVLDAKGNHFNGIGGGYCQVSSTLYNTVLAVNGLEVTERHPHSKQVYYVEKDKDAAIYTPTHLDFKFKNNTDYDIKIVADNTNEEVIVKLYSLK